MKKLDKTFQENLLWQILGRIADISTLLLWKCGKMMAFDGDYRQFHKNNVEKMMGLTTEN